MTLTGTLQVEIHQREVVKCGPAPVFMHLESFPSPTVFHVCSRNFNPTGSQHKHKDGLMFCFFFFSLPLRLPLSSDSPGLKSIMKKEGVADKQGNKRAKKNLKFVGVNGG